MNENIFDKRRLKTFSNCEDLVKSMVGTRDGVIVYNEKFRLDLENTCYKASICETLQQRIDKAIENSNQIIKDIKDFYRPTEDTIYSGDCLMELAKKNISILKGEENE